MSLPGQADEHRERITDLGVRPPDWRGLWSWQGLEGAVAVTLGVVSFFATIGGSRVWGLLLVALGVISLRQVRRSDRPAAQAARLGRSVALVLVGVALFGASQAGVELIGLVAGLAGIVGGLVRLAISPTRQRGDRSWWFASALAAVGGGLMVALFSTEIVGVATEALGIVVATLGALTLVSCVFDLPEARESLWHSPRRAWRWLVKRPGSIEDAAALRTAMLTEGPDAGRRMSRFSLLMGFSSVIATMGVITDSTAVVIGAMLIAPLMGPLMGAALSLGMGWPKLLGRHALMAAAGSALAVAISAILGRVLPGTIDLASNSQIVARVSPTLLDLVVAIAAGGAGAFALSRPDISDSLPGVAIAISLVPPLSVSGLSWQAGGYAEAYGAMLLFLTNASAILIVGATTFVFTGLIPIRRATASRQRVRTFTAGLVALVALVTLGLAVNSVLLSDRVSNRGEARAVVDEWLREHDQFTLDSVAVDGSVVTVVVSGPKPGPPAEDLHDRLQERLDLYEVGLDLRVRAQERTTVGDIQDE